MTRRAAIAALALAAFAQARGEWVTEVVTNDLYGVEYLEGDGSSYVDTGVCLRGSDIVSARMMLMSDSQYSPFFGARYPAQKISYCSQFATDDKNAIWYYHYNTTVGWYSYTVPLSEMINVWFDVVYNQTTLYVNGTSRGSKGQSYSNQMPIPFYIYAINESGTASIVRGKIRILRFSVQRGGNIIMNLLPVREDGSGQGKLVDIISGEVYSNAGTGAFTYGAVTGKVAYVSITTNRVYRAPAPMRSFDAAHPFNAPTARTRLGGTGSGEDGTTLRPSAHIAIKKNEED